MTLRSGSRQERELVHRRQRREDDVARQPLAEQPVGERGAMRQRAAHRNLIDHVVDAGDDDGDVRRRRRRRAQQLEHGAGGEAGAGAEPPLDRPGTMRLQRADQVADHRLVLMGDADAGGRRIAGDEKAERRPLAAPGAAVAASGRLGQHRRPAAGAHGLRHQQRRQRELEGQGQRRMREPRPVRPPGRAQNWEKSGLRFWKKAPNASLASGLCSRAAKMPDSTPIASSAAAAR